MDSDLVFPTLNSVYDKDVNFWYDKELKSGDIWNKEAEKILRNQNCVGAVIFLSKNSLISASICEEVKIINSIKETLADTKGFRVLPIFIGSENLSALTHEVLGINPNDLSILEKVLCVQKLVSGDKMIFEKYENCEQAAVSIENAAKAEGAIEKNVINTRESNLACLDTMIYNQKTILKLGEYPFEENEKEAALTWILVGQHQNIYYFISEFAIDFLKYNEINSKVRDVKEKLVEKKFIKNIIPLDDEFLIKYEKEISDSLPTNYADKNRQQNLRAFWIKSVTEKKYFLYNSKNVKIERAINYENINAGLRLVMEIDNSQITMEDK